MSDLQIAKRHLQKEDFSLVVAKDEKIIFETKLQGIGGFLLAIERFGREKLAGSSVADKVVGRAAALLCVYCGVKAVYATVLSEGGKEVLKENGIAFEFDNLVLRILNHQKTDTCPFEKVVSNISNAEEAYEELKSCMEEMKRSGK